MAANFAFAWTTSAVASIIVYHGDTDWPSTLLPSLQSMPTMGVLIEHLLYSHPLNQCPPWGYWLNIYFTPTLSINVHHGGTDWPSTLLPPSQSMSTMGVLIELLFYSHPFNQCPPWGYWLNIYFTPTLSINVHHGGTDWTTILLPSLQSMPTMGVLIEHLLYSHPLNQCPPWGYWLNYYFTPIPSINAHHGGTDWTSTLLPPSQSMSTRGILIDHLLYSHPLNQCPPRGYWLAIYFTPTPSINVHHGGTDWPSTLLPPPQSMPTMGVLIDHLLYSHPLNQCPPGGYWLAIYFTPIPSINVHHGGTDWPSTLLPPPQSMSIMEVPIEHLLYSHPLNQCPPWRYWLTIYFTPIPSITVHHGGADWTSTLLPPPQSMSTMGVLIEHLLYSHPLNQCPPWRYWLTIYFTPTPSINVHQGDTDWPSTLLPPPQSMSTMEVLIGHLLYSHPPNHCPPWGYWLAIYFTPTPPITVHHGDTDWPSTLLPPPQSMPTMGVLIEHLLYSHPLNQCPP